MSISTKILSLVKTPIIYNENKILMIYVLEGSLQAKRFNRIDEFQKEDLFFININETYCLNAVRPCVLLISELDSMHFKSSLHPNGDQIELISNMISAAQMKDMNLVYRDCAFIRLLLESVGNVGSNNSQQLIDKLVFSLLEDYNLIYDNAKNHKVNREILNRYYRISEDLHRNFASKFTLTAIAQQENMQKSYFAQVWKLLTNCSFLESLTKIRLQNAERMLFFTELNNEQICQQCGFSDKKYFYRYFQE